MARLQIEDDGILLDYSRQRLTTKTVQLLLALAQATGLQAKIRAMAAGEEINYTEGRPVLHMALRAPRGDKLEVDGVDVIAQVHAPTLPYPHPLTLTLYPHADTGVQEADAYVQREPASRSRGRSCGEDIQGAQGAALAPYDDPGLAGAPQGGGAGPPCPEAERTPAPRRSSRRQEAEGAGGGHGGGEEGGHGH